MSLLHKYSTPDRGAALAASLLREAGISSLPVDFHQLLAPQKNIFLIPYSNASSALSLSPALVRELSGTAPLSLLIKQHSGQCRYYFLHQSSSRPLMRIHPRQQLAEDIGKTLLYPDAVLNRGLSCEMPPTAIRQIKAFASALLCPPHLIEPIYQKSGFQTLWRNCLAPKELCFEALLNL